MRHGLVGLRCVGWSGQLHVEARPLVLARHRVWRNAVDGAGVPDGRELLGDGRLDRCCSGDRAELVRLEGARVERRCGEEVRGRPGGDRLGRGRRLDVSEPCRCGVRRVDTGRVEGGRLERRRLEGRLGARHRVPEADGRGIEGCSVERCSIERGSVEGCGSDGGRSAVRGDDGRGSDRRRRQRGCARRHPGSRGEGHWSLFARRSRPGHRARHDRAVHAADHGAGRQGDDRGHAATARARLQSDLRAGLRCELRDHVLPEVPGGHALELVETGDALVGGEQLDVGHADAVVDDRQLVAALSERPTVDLDGRVRRREAEGVLDELREQVDQVDHDRTGQRRLSQVADADTFEVLDLAHRRPDDLGDRRRRTAAARRLGAGEDQQGLGVASHSTRQVVELEEVLQERRVGLTRLERRDEVELTGEQRLVAPAEVRHRLGLVDPQGRLLAREAQRGVLDVVEGRGDLVDLGGTGGSQRGEVQLLTALVLLSLHRVGQAGRGDLLGLGSEVLQRPGDRANRSTQEQRADQDDGDRGDRSEEEQLTAPGREVVHDGDGVSLCDVLQLGQGLAALVQPCGPRGEVEGAPLGEHVAADRVGRRHRVADALDEQPELGRRRGCCERGVRLLLRRQTHQGLERGRVEGSLLGGDDGQVTLLGRSGLGTGEVVGGARCAVVHRLAGVDRHGGEVEQLIDRGGVGRQGDPTAELVARDTLRRAETEECPVGELLDLATDLGRPGVERVGGHLHVLAQLGRRRLALDQRASLRLQSVDEPVRAQRQIGPLLQPRGLGGLGPTEVHAVPRHGQQTGEGDRHQHQQSGADAKATGLVLFGLPLPCHGSRIDTGGGPVEKMVVAARRAGDEKWSTGRGPRPTARGSQGPAFS